MNIKQKTPSQWLWIVVIAVLTILLAVGLLWNNKSKTAESAAQGEQENMLIRKVKKLNLLMMKMARNMRLKKALV